MSISDDELLRFAQERTPGWDDHSADMFLKQYPELYRNHLLIAKHLDQWFNALGRNTMRLPLDKVEATLRAVSMISTALREGYYLPGGAYFQAVVSAEPAPGGPISFDF